ncbi:MAG: alpha/beta hydrolase [Cytophagaceae bacterium]|nr:alpha/beta hydrolase [Cytophagaceae bacterium]MBK9510375.1 alpha/beta hydrolase [Cytophagaceae bacterium]MBK9936029.1 alpha/beta hydrolase [Cytophagaceae bacterium]MBL0304085.1 alpha/beta hydrolase [Cytophagaceae bacterium]MBL0326894.1 alpha/beta hydrolase [Cytophagaceae bacterium]
MPFLTLSNAEYYYEEYGSGSETIVFAHGLLWSHWMFHNQIEYLQKNFRIIAFDFRGQGKTKAKNSKYDMESLYNDSLELIKILSDKPVIFAGLSMGGYIGMRLAARNPEWIKKVVLMESSSEAEPAENIARYKMLNTLVRTVGYWPVEKQIMNIMFGKTFLNDVNRKAEYEVYLKKLKENNRTTITLATEGVISRGSFDDELKNIKVPTLILVGEEDVPAPIEKSEFLHKNIENSVLKVIPNAGHTGVLENPEQYNLLIEAFVEA